MKILRLSDLRRKKNNYFKNIGIFNPEGKTLKQIKYIVERSYDSIPKSLKKYHSKEDRFQAITVLTHTIKNSGINNQINSYEAIRENLEKTKKHTGDYTLEFVYREFRNQAQSVYSKYNTYVYRLGQSSSDYFKKNVDYTLNGSVGTFTVDLPFKEGGIIYETLTIMFDFSGKALISAEMI